MTRGEQLFFICWGMLVFPSLLLYLHMEHALEIPVVDSMLLYMGGLKVVYAGARGFESWNASDDPPGHRE